jgi:hypothetical protein
MKNTCLSFMIEAIIRSPLQGLVRVQYGEVTKRPPLQGLVHIVYGKVTKRAHLQSYAPNIRKAMQKQTCDRTTNAEMYSPEGMYLW